MDSCRGVRGRRGAGRPSVRIGGGVSRPAPDRRHQVPDMSHLGFGDRVEILRPDRLRRAVRDRAERIARIHARAEVAIDPLLTPAPRLAPSPTITASKGQQAP
jgi:hypothetical protein